MHLSLPQRHRHFVALPLLALVLLLSFQGRQNSSNVASVIAESSSVRILADGTNMVPTEGAVFDQGVLVQGSGLFSAPGILTVHTPAFDVLGMAGAVHVTVSGPSITIVALSSPALVSRGGEHVAIVPVGYQREIADVVDPLQSVPDFFLRDQFLALQRFPSADASLPTAETLPSPDGASLPLVFSQAHERQIATARTQIIGVLHHRLDAGDLAGVRTILADPAYQFALQDPQSFSALVTLANLIPAHDASIRSGLLTALSTDHALWMLAALHPVLRAAVWSLPSPALPPHDQHLMVAILCAADNQPESFPSTAMQWWEATVLILNAQSDPLAGFLPLVIRSNLPFVSEYAGQGYPVRASVLLAALHRLAEGVSLPSSTLADFAVADDIVARTIPLTERASSSQSSSSVSIASSVTSMPVQKLPAGVIRSRAEQMLTEASALFLLQTKITAGEGSSAHIADIAFPGSTTDHTYSFDLDVTTGQVSSIVKDGDQMLYPLTFEKFQEWVRE